ncbi:amidohydrolase family protein [Thermodesulfobacteriota bacterium]
MTMIIDAHCHIADGTWYPQWWWDALTTYVPSRYGHTQSQSLELRKKSWDPTGDTAVNSMDGAGIDKAVTCVGDFGLVKEEPPTPIEEVNRLTGEMVKRHPGRLYFNCGVDPRRKNALEIVEASAKEWGAVGVKLHPATGWYPSDKDIYPLYKKCIELGLHVDFHTGPLYPPTKSKYCHPLVFDEVASDFPELTIQCTHAADTFYMEMVGIAKVRRNIVLDLAAWQRWLRASRSTAIEFYRIVRFIMDMVGPRLMFGSDWSGFPDFAPYRGWVKAFTDIPAWVKEAGIEFTKEEMDGFLGGNALRLLHLDKR